MESPKCSAKKAKQLPYNFTQKTRQLVSSIQNDEAQWLNDSVFRITQSVQSVKEINRVFDMGFKTYIKFLKFVGCKVKQPKKYQQQLNSQPFYKVFLPTQNVVHTQQNTLKQFMKTVNCRDEYHPNFQQVSLQMNLHRPDLQLLNLQHENQLKNAFLKEFKQNIDNTNKFVDQSIYRILVGKEISKMTKCELFQILTELRDRLFDNQRQLQQCIQSFQLKIKSFSHEISNQSMQPQEFPTLKGKNSIQQLKVVNKDNENE